MRVYFFIGLLCAVNADSQYWNNNFLPSWFRVPKSANIRDTTIASERTTLTINETTTVTTTGSVDLSTSRIKIKSTTGAPKVNSTASLLKERNINPVSTTPISSSTEKSTTAFTTSTVNEGSTIYDTTLLDSATTEDLRDISRTHEFYLSKRNKPQIKISTNISQVRNFFEKKYSWFPSKTKYVWNLDTFSKNYCKNIKLKLQFFDEIILKNDTLHHMSSFLKVNNECQKNVMKFRIFYRKNYLLSFSILLKYFV